MIQHEGVEIPIRQVQDHNHHNHNHNHSHNHNNLHNLHNLHSSHLQHHHYQINHYLPLNLPSSATTATAATFPLPSIRNKQHSVLVYPSPYPNSLPATPILHSANVSRPGSACASPCAPAFANLSVSSVSRAINIPTNSSPSSPSSSFPALAAAAPRSKHKHSRSSYSETSSALGSRNNSVTFRPPKRQMQTPNKTIAVINSSGRQAASVIRVATAVGYRVRAQLRSLDGFIATEVATNPNVTVIVGELYTRSASHHGSPAHPGDLHSQRTGGSESSTCSDREDVTRKGPEPVAGVGVNHALISELFQGADLAFINTTFYGDELQIGKALLDAAKAAGIQHYVYSSMPDHSAYDPEWPALPLWAAKHQVEDYVRESGIPATFVYTGIYNNNFTGLIYPLFCMELQEDGSFEWQAPFHRDAKLPWLDAEHDMGPAILQIFKDGPSKWADRRIALAYEMLTPLEACEVFSRGVGRPVKYIQAPIDIKVKIPTGYRQQLEALEKLFTMGGDDPTKQPPYFGDAELEKSCPEQAMELWEGPRLLEEYAREVFPVEEHANGLRWMIGDWDEEGEDASGAEDEEEEEDEGLEMKARKRDEEKWLA